MFYLYKLLNRVNANVCQRPLSCLMRVGAAAPAGSSLSHHIRLVKLPPLLCHIGKVSSLTNYDWGDVTPGNNTLARRAGEVELTPGGQIRAVLFTCPSSRTAWASHPSRSLPGKVHQSVVPRGNPTKVIKSARCDWIILLQDFISPVFPSQLFPARNLKVRLNSVLPFLLILVKIY